MNVYQAFRQAGYYAALFLVTIGAATMASSQPVIGGKRMENLCDIRTITSGPWEHNHAYPTCRTWSRDSRKVFIESNGPGPDGVAAPGTWHIMAVDVETLEKEYLVSMEAADATAPAWFAFDYAPEGNCIAYMDPGSHDIYLLNLTTGKKGLIYREAEGTLAGPLTIANDATRIGWWVMLPSIANRWFDDYITVIFTIDVDPAACGAIGEPRIAEAYPRRKLPGWDQNPVRGIHVNHPQINPSDRDHLVYSHEMRGADPDGSIAMSRLWETRADEDANQCLIHQPAGLHFTHEVIAPDGKSLIFPYMHGVGQVFFGSRKRKSLYYNKECCPGHLTVSPDQKWIAGDTWGRWKDEEGREFQSVMMFDVKTRRAANLCWFNHSHPHPNFSPDGRKIAFSHVDDDKHTQIGVIEVSDVQRNWRKVYQQQGEVASPFWR